MSLIVSMKNPIFFNAGLLAENIMTLIIKNLYNLIFETLKLPLFLP